MGGIEGDKGGFFVWKLTAVKVIEIWSLKIKINPEPNISHTIRRETLFTEKWKENFS